MNAKVPALAFEPITQRAEDCGKTLSAHTRDLLLADLAASEFGRNDAMRMHFLRLVANPPGEIGWSGQ